MMNRARQILFVLVLSVLVTVTGDAQTDSGAFLLADWTANYVDSLPDAGTLFILPLCDLKV